MLRDGLRVHLAALTGYALLAVLLTWPLPLHLATHLTGPPSGDAGVYVWNIWVFRHEAVEHGHLPFFTGDIFALGPDRADLSLHNYTAFTNLLALPLIPVIGVVVAFNVLYLLHVTLAAWAMFLLARRVTGATIESWLTGAVFACSPVLIARGTAHFSLVAAAPLPIFMLALMRAVDRRTVRAAIAAGAVIAWAVFCDVYYGVYCVLLAAVFLASHSIVVYRREPVLGFGRPLKRLLDILIVFVTGLVVGILIRGGGAFGIGGVQVSVRTLYTPVLILTLFVAFRLALRLRARLTLERRTGLVASYRLAAAAVLTTALILSPVLYALGVRVKDGRYVSPPVHWRSSPPGVDLLAFFTPNPNHRLLGGADGFRERLTGVPGAASVERVASVSLVALAVVVLAWWRYGFKPPRAWTAVTLFFAWLSLGPFVAVAGFNTHVPTPWTLLRYLPLVGSARSPSRFPVVVAMGLAVLFALALSRILEAHPRRRKTIVAAVAGLLALELTPAPRRLYAAEVPAIYRIIAADPRDIRVLELPTGIRDGASSYGNFSALWQFYQTVHEKALLGGYLSRVSRHRVSFYRRVPMLDALYTLSEGTALTPAQAAAARMTRERFLERARVAYVVVHNDRASPELRRFAIDTLRLRKIAESSPIELFVPAETAK